MINTMLLDPFDFIKTRWSQICQNQNIEWKLLFIFQNQLITLQIDTADGLSGNYPDFFAFIKRFRLKVNLLFFGNYYRMNFDDFDSGMKKMMNDRDFLYGSLTRDVYSQGLVLGRKYRLLRKGYNVFMYGIVISVIAFFVSSVLR